MNKIKQWFLAIWAFLCNELCANDLGDINTYEKLWACNFCLKQKINQTSNNINDIINNKLYKKNNTKSTEVEIAWYKVKNVEWSANRNILRRIKYYKTMIDAVIPSWSLWDNTKLKTRIKWWSVTFWVEYKF